MTVDVNIHPDLLSFPQSTRTTPKVQETALPIRCNPEATLHRGATVVFSRYLLRGLAND